MIYICNIYIYTYIYIYSIHLAPLLPTGDARLRLRGVLREAARSILPWEMICPTIWTVIIPEFMGQIIEKWLK